MAELDYGSEKATSESEKLRSYLLPPPAAMTTNCLPDFPINVIGLAKALAGRRVSQSNLPVDISKARKRWSLVAPMKTSPPAVTIDPPILAVPVGGMPLAVRASISPSTLRQRNVP